MFLACQQFSTVPNPKKLAKKKKKKKNKTKHFTPKQTEHEFVFVPTMSIPHLLP
jgi:hypothetical protein